MNWLRAYFERALRARLLYVLDGCYTPTAPRGIEQVGPLTLVWGLHQHVRLIPLREGLLARCRCGAVYVAQHDLAADGWYLPEQQVRAAQESVIDAVRSVLGVPTLHSMRVADEQERARNVPTGGVAGAEEVTVAE